MGCKLSGVCRCMAELASALPVDLMPGPGDLTNHSLPQQALHRCLFPGAGPYASFHRVTNPYRCSLDGTVMLGSSGQNIADVHRCASCPLDAHMRWCRTTYCWAQVDLEHLAQSLGGAEHAAFATQEGV